VRIARRRK
jgi:hypothetical protein